VHGVSKVPARRANEIGEHNEEVLAELGFGTVDINRLRTSGVVPGGPHFEEAPKESRSA
jgi:crotonobetainyl-CoA:carnitine CoA-transferase CaiB-like acyl-CoA transferase